MALRGQRFALLPMTRYIELKASGMVAPHRAKDLVDVQELIKSAALSVSIAASGRRRTSIFEKSHPASSDRWACFPSL